MSKTLDGGLELLPDLEADRAQVGVLDGPHGSSALPLFWTLSS
jgi:hypothetical protein